MKRRSRKQKTVRYGQLENRQLLAADVGVATDLLTSTDSSAEVSELTIAESDDVVLGWNNLFGEILVEDTSSQNPGYASRSMAILNLAIYDAVALASGDADTAFYEYDFNVSSNTNAEVAASQAAYTVLTELYPDQEASIEAYFESTLDGLHSGSTLTTSLAVGVEIGTTILEARADDGSDATVDYVYSGEVGEFAADPLNPDVPVWGPGWGEVETFAVSSVDDLLPDGTPDLDSQAYADSYNEVLELGSVDSTVRTADQTETGLFWAYDTEGLGTPMALFGDVLETIAIQEGNSLEENAALFAQASVAMADAGIVAWQVKFSDEFWRPVTAIHSGDIDGNDLTEGDADWVALGAPDGVGDELGFTPQFPTYISGHATFGGALFGAIQEFYGTDDIAFDLDSQELEYLLDDPELQAAYGISLDDATRSFSSLSEAMAENGRSRVYLGIHFDFDDIDGQAVGQAVATEVASQFTVATDDGAMDHGRRVDSHNHRRDRHGSNGDDRGRGDRSERGSMDETLVETRFNENDQRDSSRDSRNDNRRDSRFEEVGRKAINLEKTDLAFAGF